MGRKEGCIKAEHEAVAELASQLRKLRAAAGEPTYRSMAAQTHYAATTLSRAAAGSRLPSLDVVLAYARACGGDHAEWTKRWERANAALEPPREVSGPPVPAPAAVRESDRLKLSLPVRIGAGGTAALLGIALLTIAGVIMIVVAHGKPRSSPVKVSSLSAASRIDEGSAASTISDGDDPRADSCAATGDAQAAALGAKEVSVLTVRAHNGTVIGWLALWRNPRCGAEWAEASYVNPHLYPVTLEAHRPADGATVIDNAVVNLPRDPVIGQLLTTAEGCVWARMTLSIPQSAPVIVQTPCL